MGEGSDLDLLVVMPEGTHRRHTAQLLYRQLTGIKVPFDILVATPEDLRKTLGNSSSQNSQPRILLDLIATIVHLPLNVDKAAVLTDYAVMTRYPGDFEPVTQDEYELALQLAEGVVNWVATGIQG